MLEIHQLCKIFSAEQHSIILPVHCLTGCDAVSRFYGHGKCAAFKLLYQKANEFKCLSSLGDLNGISSVERETVTRFVCGFYDKSDCTSLNSVCCEKAQHGISPKKLPHTNNSFVCHLLHTWGQLLIWKEATVQNPVLPQIEHAGFQENCNKSYLDPIMMTQDAAAPVVLNGLVSECVPGCCNEDYKFAVNLQPCTAVCDCKAYLPDDTDVCTNSFTLSAMFAGENDSDSE